MGTQTSTLLPPTLEPAVLEKLGLVLDRLAGLGSIMVAFSGGVDSALVLRAALAVVPGKVLAATGLSASYAEEEIAEAKAVAAQLGAPHIMVETMELTDSRYADNTHQRCFFCKTELYSKLKQAAAAEGIKWVVDGANTDDTGDFRPGMRAAREQGVRSPLLEVGLTKSEIRAASQALALPTWDKPAAACLSSRFAYGDPITVEKLKQVSAAETFLRSLGYRGFRVR